MSLLSPYLAACLLLVGAGIAKVLRPDDTVRAALALARRREADGSRAVPAGGGAARAVPAGGGARLAVRAVVAFEALVGLAGLLWPGTVTAALVAGSFTAFSAVVLLTRRRGGVLASCGCFGRPDTPATRLHAALNLGLAAAAAVVAGSLGSHSTLWHLLAARHLPLAGVPLLVISVVMAFCCYLVMSFLPRLAASELGLR